jgi:peptidoglycan/LPS O-acetylase OafA/YrhL
MGRDLPPPGYADSWGEFHARMEQERAALSGRWSPLWRSAAAVLCVVGLLFCAYGLQDGHWWLWVGMIVSLAIVATMASRAMSNAERNSDRAAELHYMEQEWQAHLERHSPRA